MNWGLASFERKRIERIATEHPFFDMHAPLLNKMELRDRKSTRLNSSHAT